MNRRPDEMPPLPPLPAIQPNPRGIELANMVSAADSAILQKTLRKYGASEQTIKRLRMLDDIAPTSGQFMALALDKTQRSFFVQTIQLGELAEELYNDLRNPEKYVNEELRLFAYKAYTEMVKQGGVAMKTVLEGMAVMVSTLKDGRDEKENTGVKAKPKWGQGR